MRLVVGVGLRANTPYAELRALVDSALEEAGRGEVQLITTVAGKEAEPAVRRLADDLNAELRAIPPDELAEQTRPTRASTSNT